MLNVVLKVLRLRWFAPAGKGFYHAQNHKADPEIHDQPQIKMGSDMAGRCWQIGHNQEIDRIPAQNRDQRVHEVTHSGFRHRSPPW